MACQRCTTLRTTARILLNTAYCLCFDNPSRKDAIIAAENFFAVVTILCNCCGCRTVQAIRHEDFNRQIAKICDLNPCAPEAVHGLYLLAENQFILHELQENYNVICDFISKKPTPSPPEQGQEPIEDIVE